MTLKRNSPNSSKPCFTCAPYCCSMATSTRAVCVSESLNHLHHTQRTSRYSGDMSKDCNAFKLRLIITVLVFGIIQVNAPKDSLVLEGQSERQSQQANYYLNIQEDLIRRLFNLLWLVANIVMRAKFAVNLVA